MSNNEIIIDVSHWQGTIDWNKVVEYRGPSGQRMTGAIVRTGDGKTPDRQCVRNLQEAKRVGLKRGVYHYLRAEHGAEVNWQVVGDQLRRAKHFDPSLLELGISVDLEGRPEFRGRPPTGAWQDVDKGQPGAPSTSRVLEVAAEVARLSLRCGFATLLYTGRAWLDHIKQSDNPQAWDYLTQRPLWHAVGARGERVTPWTNANTWLKQYSNRGAIPGIDGDVDLNMVMPHAFPQKKPVFTAHDLGEVREQAGVAMQAYRVAKEALDELIDMIDDLEPPS